MPRQGKVAGHSQEGLQLSSRAALAFSHALEGTKMQSPSLKGSPESLIAVLYLVSLMQGGEKEQV